MPQCLEYAKDQFVAFQGYNPSSGANPGQYWNNATNKQSGMRVPSIAIWVNSSSTTEGHALYIHQYDTAMQAYKIYEANWDPVNKPLQTRVTYVTDVKGMYPNKVWKGCVY